MGVHRRKPHSTGKPDYIVRQVKLESLNQDHLQLKHAPGSTMSGTPLKFAILGKFGDLQRCGAINQHDFDCMKERVLQITPTASSSPELELFQLQVDELQNLFTCRQQGDVSHEEYDQFKVQVLNLVVAAQSEIDDTSAVHGCGETVSEQSGSAVNSRRSVPEVIDENIVMEANEAAEDEHESNAGLEGEFEVIGTTPKMAASSSHEQSCKKPTRRGGQNKRIEQANQADVSSLPGTDDGFGIGN